MAKLLLFSLFWAVNVCPSLQRPPFWMRELWRQQRAGTGCRGPGAAGAGQVSPSRGDDAFPCLWVRPWPITEGLNFTPRCPAAAAAAGAVPRGGGRCACAPGSRCGAWAAGRAPPGGAGRAGRAPVARRRRYAGQGAVGAAGRPAGRLVPAAAGRLPAPRRVLPVARGDGR